MSEFRVIEFAHYCLFRLKDFRNSRNRYFPFHIFSHSYFPIVTYFVRLDILFLDFQKLSLRLCFSPLASFVTLIRDEKDQAVNYELPQRERNDNSIFLEWKIWFQGSQFSILRCANRMDKTFLSVNRYQSLLNKKTILARTFGVWMDGWIQQ